MASATPPGYPAKDDAPAKPAGNQQPAVGYPQQGYPGGPQGWQQGGYPAQQGWQQGGYPAQQGWQQGGPQPYGQPPPQHYQGYPPPPPPQGMYVQQPCNRPQQGAGAEGCLLACLAATCFCCALDAIF